MNAYNIVSESVVVQEWFGADDAVMIGAKNYNINKRTQKILSTYPTPQALAQRLRQSGVRKAIKLANKLEGLDEFQYRKFVAKYFGGNTMMSWVWNIIFAPIAAAHQVANTAQLHNRDDSADSIIRQRL